MKSRVWMYVVLMVFSVVFTASANTISLTPLSSSLVLKGDDSRQNAIDQALNSKYPGLALLYKGERVDENSAGVSSEDFAASYATMFFNADLADSDARITWINGAPSINSLPVYALIKDGISVPNWYVFDISGWNGMDTIEVSGFFIGAKQTRDISHVSIYGNQIQTTTRVPDGASTVAILGIAIVGLAGLRRMFT
jgi:hypothetical protein